MSGLDGFRWKKGKKERSPPHTRTDHENLRPPLFLNSSFSSLLPASTFVRPHSSLCLIPPPPPIFLMVKTVGPWQLDDVKARLRAEQVGRERAASARYRRQERQDSGEDNKGKTSWAQCIFLLALSCFLLSLSVLALASAFLSLTKK